MGRSRVKSSVASATRGLAASVAPRNTGVPASFPFGAIPAARPERGGCLLDGARCAGRRRRLTPNPVPVAVEPVRVWSSDSKIPVRDLAAVKVRRRRRNADRWVSRIARLVSRDPRIRCRRRPTSQNQHGDNEDGEALGHIRNHNARAYGACRAPPIHRIHSIHYRNRDVVYPIRARFFLLRPCSGSGFGSRRHFLHLCVQ